jgi:signal transduction histidine kinase
MHRRHLRTKDYTSYAEAIEREARVLMARGVSEEHAIMALAFRLECSLAGLLHDDLHEKSFALTLARVTSGVQRFLLSGYASARAAGWHQADEVERKKLSQDLHDEVGADLVVLKLYIEMIALELRRDRLEVARAKLEEALALVSHALESVRRLTLDLGPAILEQLGLIPALKLYCRQFAGRTGIAVKVEGAEIPASLPHGHETTLYRVLQGALSNVAKHSKARHVRVALGGLRDSVLVMVIEDDGIGFDVPAEARHGGFGLTAMRDRILALGGRLHIESRLASGGGRKGTRIEIDLPASPDRGLP